MALVFDGESFFYSIRLDSQNFTDGYALVTGGVDIQSGTPDFIAERIHDAYATIWMPFTSNQVTLTTVEVLGENLAGSYTEQVAGTGTTGNTAAPNVAVLLNKNTSLRGRRAQGRNFLPGIANDALIDEAGNLDPQYLGDLQNAADAWLQLGQAGSRDHRIPQSETRPRKDGTPGTPPILPWPSVNSFGVDPKVSTQRRRLRR